MYVVTECSIVTSSIIYLLFTTKDNAMVIIIYTLDYTKYSFYIKYSSKW